MLLPIAKPIFFSRNITAPRKVGSAYTLSTCKKLSKLGYLRTPVRKYREFRDSTKKSNFFLFFQKVPFDELFSKKVCKRSSAFYFLRNKENSKMRPDRPRSLMEIMQNRAFSIFIFPRTENCLKFILGQVVIHLYEILSRYISF